MNMNKYALRKNGVTGANYIVEQEKIILTNVAKEKGKDNVEDAFKGFLGDRFKSNVAEGRNLSAPCLLQTYCNIAELARIRQEIILAATETAILTQIYMKQCALVGEKNSRVELDSGITWEQGEEEQNREHVNFCEDGPAHLDTIKLAIREFDPQLLSNFNFRNPDSLKLNILNSGLEEARAILQYQVLQK